MFFGFLRNSCPLFSIPQSSSFSLIHVSVNIKNNAEKDPTLLFFLSKSPGRPCDFLPNKPLSCIWVAIPVDWVILHWYACGADRRSVGWCTVTWLPNFLRWVDYHISLAMGLRPAWRSAITVHCGCKIFKMAARVEKFRRLHALFFNRHSYFLRSFFSIS